jgi:hypothetical protein
MSKKLKGRWKNNDLPAKVGSRAISRDQTHGEDPRKDRCPQIGADTLPDGMRDVGYRVRVARPRDGLRRTTMVLQRQREAEHAPGRGEATEYEVA